MRLLVILVLMPLTVLADPATEETLQALDASVTQNSMFLMITAHAVLLILGFIAGQQR